MPINDGAAGENVLIVRHMGSVLADKHPTGGMCALLAFGAIERGVSPFKQTESLLVIQLTCCTRCIEMVHDGLRHECLLAHITDSQAGGTQPQWKQGRLYMLVRLLRRVQP